MGVNFILNFMSNLNMNFILFYEVIQIKPTLKLNEILNQALLKEKIEEICIHSRARPTILLYLFLVLLYLNMQNNLFQNIFKIFKMQIFAFAMNYCGKKI